MKPLPTWRYLVEMARYKPWLYLLHAVLWGAMNLVVAAAGADRPRLLRYAHRAGAPARRHDGTDRAAGGARA